MHHVWPWISLTALYNSLNFQASTPFFSQQNYAISPGSFAIIEQKILKLNCAVVKPI